MKRHDTRQLPLFDSSSYERPKREKPTLWYYLVDGREQRMVLTWDADGVPVFTDHDLQHTVPHVYNSLSTAKADAKRYSGLKVKTSRYKIRNGQWIKPDTARGK
jgi:hypothetical protein